MGSEGGEDGTFQKGDPDGLFWLLKEGRDEDEMEEEEEDSSLFCTTSSQLSRAQAVAILSLICSQICSGFAVSRRGSS